MKLFVLGIDAASEKILRAFDMPFTHRLMNTFHKEDLKEDLYNRGWAEAYSGKSAGLTKAFYELPVLNSSYEWSLSFGLKDIPKNEDLIWNVLNKRGYSVGLMNIPTASPAQKVNGFFVAGGGGGKALKDGFDASVIHPENESSVLTSSDYILDERVPSLIWKKKIYEFNLFFDRLILMMSNRVDAYLKLDAKHSPDYGFFVFRAVAVVQYLAMAEIERYIDGIPLLSRGLEKELIRFYKKLDSCIEKLFVGLNPEQSVLISDHGMVTLDTYVNFNSILENHGFYEKSTGASLTKSILQKYKHLVPYFLRQRIKSNKNLKSKYKSVIEFNSKNTRAFSMGSVAGVFINDKRFGGCVKDAERPELIKEICENLNQDQEFKKYGFKAYKYRTNYIKERFSDHMPDIMFELPDGFKPTGTGGYIVKNKARDAAIKLREVKDDNWTGVKGCETLFYTSPELKQFIADDDPRNLMLTFKVAERYLK